MFKKLLWWIGLFLLISSYAQENPKYRWIMDKPKNPPKNFAKIKRYLENEIFKIETWMEDQGYPKTKIDGILNPRSTGQIIIRNVYEEALTKNAGKGKDRKISKDQIKKLKNTIASYGADSAIVIIDSTMLKEIYSTETKLTLAHELFHGSQATVRFSSKEEDAQRWVTEGTAEAAGLAYIKNNGTYLWETYYDTSLFAPKSSGGEDEPYQRGHFFFKLGEDIGDMKYLGEFIKRPLYGNGIAWLDASLQNSPLEKTLAEYYPTFIQKHTDKSFFKDKDYPSISLSIPSKTKDEKKRQIKSIASTFDAVDITFEDVGWENKKNGERIYVVSIYITNAQRKEDLKLIASHKIVSASEKIKKIYYAQKGSLKKLFPINVTNVAPTASNSKKQKFILGVQASPLTFELPACVQAGTKAKISLKGDLTTDEYKKLYSKKLKKGGIKLSVSAGKINNNLEFTAPKQAQKVKVYLTLLAINGKKKRIKLGTINVQKNYCGIELVFMNTMRIIWDPRKQINEATSFDDPEEITLFHHNIAYIYDPEEGWESMDFDKMSQQMSIVRDGVQRSGASSLLPMMETFMYQAGGMEPLFPTKVIKQYSWKNVKKQGFQCRTSTHECTLSSDQGLLRTTYDRHLRLTGFYLGDEEYFRLRYGNFSTHDLPKHFKKTEEGHDDDNNNESYDKDMKHTDIPKEMQEMMNGILSGKEPSEEMFNQMMKQIKKHP